jgi:hypothetical protein
MADTGSVVLSCLDVFGNFIGERVDIILKNQTLSDSRRVQGQPATKRMRISELRADTNNVYQLQVFAHSYLAAGRFVTVSSSSERDVTLTFPVDPRKVLSVNFPEFRDLAEDTRALLARSSAVLGAEGMFDEALYTALPDLSRAGLLNICAKCGRTRLSTGETVLSQIGELLEVRGDRFFARVPKTLREDTKNSALAGVFDPASDLLHRPPDGFTHAGSWKTPDGFGNLQLSFFSKGEEWRADIDIDDRNGFAHLFQLITNIFTGGTHPYNIHEILIAHQELDPGYRFVLG